MASTPAQSGPGSQRTRAGFSRRGFLVGGAVAAGAVLFGSGAAAAGTTLTTPSTSNFWAFSLARQRVYEFLDTRMDMYGSGTDMRLPRSYQGGYFSTATFDFLSSFAYDDALVILAYLARGQSADVERAVALGKALRSLQDRDPIGDGRTRASYQPDSFPVNPAFAPDIGSPAANSGNQAWVGLAYLRLYRTTGDQDFLDGALLLAQWLQTHTADTTVTPYGYRGGRDGDDNPYAFKATEHNIDITAFFTQLALITGDDVWNQRAEVAASFVAAMQADDGYLWTGTAEDSSTTNYYPIPGDVQAWAYLATRDDRYTRSVSWLNQTLATTDGPYSGITYSNTDLSKVWFEGTAHLALALRVRDAAGDAARVGELFADLQTAQLREENGDKRGIVAASSDGLDTGYGDLYYASLHTGATAWTALALMNSNPFRLPDQD